MRHLTAFMILTLLSSAALTGTPRVIRQDNRGKTVLISTWNGLSLRLNYERGCSIDQVVVRGENLLGHGGQVTTGMKMVGGTCTSLRSAQPTVASTESTVVISGIRPEGTEHTFTERWRFAVRADGIHWRIERTYAGSFTCDWIALPSWEFASPSTWKAAFLGTGGVAWFHLIDSANATLGVHTGSATFWNDETRTALKIAAVGDAVGDATGGASTSIASSFTRLPGGGIRLRFSAADHPHLLRYDAGMHRRRYLTSRDDVWQDTRVRPSKVVVEMTISAPDPATMFPDESMPPFRASSIRALGRTVARLGVIDANLFGSNSWRTPYGPVCLHEPHIAQMASLIQDENYVNGYKATLNSYRDHAVRPDGRVISRWAYTCEDAMPGTCDSLGFYEAQWGILMDSNPDLVTNVAELFDFCADTDWLRGHKASCERALEYMLARDTDADGLVEMMTDDHTQQRGSDWIDIIWASHENAFVNAKMYYALVLWADCEELLGDAAHAERYRRAAARLKESFNKSTIDGGFWDNSNRWYVHWRDRDGSVHGNNLVTYINFMAIAYGLCDDPVRKRVILGRIEAEMENEKLFFWPVCVFSYEEGEGLHWQWPFPMYENGDIFLTLGEVGVRAYADVDPRIPVKYIANLLRRYEQDGLAFQRYSRKAQKGEGDDILAGNAMAVVGLYRNLYGLRPKHDRLIVDPRPVPEILGTRLTYDLRGRAYRVAIDSGRTTVSTGNVQISSPGGFAIRAEENRLSWFSGITGTSSLSVLTPKGSAFAVSIEGWEEQAAGIRSWKQKSGAGSADVRYEVCRLAPGSQYTVAFNGKKAHTLPADKAGTIKFSVKGSAGREIAIQVGPVQQ